jgi:hypothetical protein
LVILLAVPLRVFFEALEVSRASVPALFRDVLLAVAFFVAPESVRSPARGMLEWLAVRVAARLLAADFVVPAESPVRFDVVARTVLETVRLVWSTVDARLSPSSDLCSAFALALWLRAAVRGLALPSDSFA